jgi:hypothetical protein
MTRNRSTRIIIAVILAAILMVPASLVSAQTGPAAPPPIAIKGPRLSPPPIPHSSVLNPYVIYNNLLVPPGLPTQSVEANAADAGRTQEKPGRGIRQTATQYGYGIKLYSSPGVCNSFDLSKYWVAETKNPWPTDIWTDWYAGWGPFAIDNGYYQAKNVTFSTERTVGPGSSWGKDNRSAKIASNQPYAAGFGSPLIPVPAGYEGGQVMVSVKYLIWDHDSGGKQGGPDGMDYDWASMGIKPDAYGDNAYYVNGYVRGEWAEMTHTVDLVDAQNVMVLIQGHSPGAFNSNIYFDDVKVAFVNADGVASYVTDCTLAK